MTLTNTTSSIIYLPGVTIPAHGTATLADQRYLTDEGLRREVNSLAAAGAITVSSAPAGFPVAVGEDADAYLEGGTGGLTTTTVVLTNAQILTLFSNPAVLVQPTETPNYSGLPTRIPVPVACTAVGVSAGTTAYGHSTARDLELFLSTGEDVLVGKSMRCASVDINDIADNVTTLHYFEPHFKLPTDGRTTIAATFELYEPEGQLDGNLQDNGLVLSLRRAIPSGDTGDLTGGTAGNKLLVTLTYAWLPLS